jgi:copper(I)-binding protein
MKRVVAPIILMAGLLVTGLAQAESALTVEDPWIQEAPPMASSLAGYMILNNASDRDRALVAVSSDAFGAVMMHRSVTEGGVARMVHQMKIDVPAHSKVVFQPGGYHLMLMKPKRRYEAGDRVGLRLKFADGETMDVEFPVRKGGGGKEMDHSHMH